MIVRHGSRAVDVPESRIAELARAIIESRSGADTFGSDGGEVSFPYFISPEQAMRERSELARKGIAPGQKRGSAGLCRWCAVRRGESVAVAAEDQ